MADEHGPVLVYDGDCGFCVATAAWLVRRGTLPAARCRPFQAFTGEDEARLRAAGIRNELALHAPGVGVVATGADALLGVLRSGPTGWLARPLAWAPLRPLVALLYRTASYNRRVIAPVPPERVGRCACDPDPHAGYRTLFVLLGLLLGLVAATLDGALTARVTLAGPAAAGARLGALAWAVGWGPPLLLALLLGGARRGLLAAHVAWLAAAGGAVLLVSVVLVLLLGLVAPPDVSGLVALLGVLVAWLVVLGMAARRVPRLPVPWAAFGVQAASTAAGILLAAARWPGR